MSLDLGIERDQLLAMLADQEAGYVIDELLPLPSPNPTDAPDAVALSISMRRDDRIAPAETTTGDRPLCLPVGQLRTLLEELPAGTIVRRIERIPGEAIGWRFLASATGEVAEQARAAIATADPSKVGQIFVAPPGTALPTTDQSLTDQGFVPLGTIGEGEFTTSTPADETPAPGFGKRSWTLPIQASEGFGDFIDSLLDAQDDQTISAADRAVDAVDLDRLAAELRLMLPEPADLAAADLVAPAPEQYSAQAIVEWFREEVGRARRRAYRTGYAMGRHAGEHQEPTA